MRAGFHLRGFTCFLPVILVLAAAKGFAGGDPASPEEIQKKRTANMKTINKNMRQLKVSITKRQFDRIGATATAVAERVAKIPELSPEGSAHGPKSRIKPEVWKNFARYIDFAERSAEAARSLAKVAGSQDQKKVMGSFLALAKSCTKCHKPYRKKIKRRR